MRNLEERPHHVCTKCHVKHVDNCDICFGFGLKSLDGPEGPRPISAGDSFRHEFDSGWFRCPECGGTPQGVKK